jgi:uncharacterized protein
MKQSVVLQPAQGAAFELPKGARFRITDLAGHQVSDLVVFPADDLHERFSPGNTRKLNNSLLLTTGSILYSTKCKSLLHIVEDSVGRHDITSSWCSAYDYPIRFGVSDHPSCLGILIGELSRFGVDESMIPEPFNVFMRTTIDPNSGAIEVLESPATAGDSIVFESATDCLVALTVCPQDQNACNGWKISPLQLDIIDLSE